VNANHTDDDSGTVGPISAATALVITSAEALDDTALRADSLCPGWSRAHVLTHLARNADALTNLLEWAATGHEHVMYASAESRASDIEDGAQRSAEDLVDDLRTSAGRFDARVSDMPDDGWLREVRMGPGGRGRTIPGRRILWERLQELEVHHVDLACGYSPAQWSPQFVERALSETVRGFQKREDAPVVTLVHGGRTEHIGEPGGPTVSGPSAAVLAWLTGRSDGSDLSVHGGDLPPLPSWR
jgi:maleylpyruvate isomerase